MFELINNGELVMDNKYSLYRALEIKEQILGAVSNLMHKTLYYVKNWCLKNTISVNFLKTNYYL